MDDSSTIDGDSDDATIRDPSKMYRQKKRKQKKDTHAQTISEIENPVCLLPQKRRRRTTYPFRLPPWSDPPGS